MERHDQPQVQSADHWLPPAAVLLTVLGLVVALLVVLAPRAGAATPSTPTTGAAPGSRDNLSLPGVAPAGSSADIEAFMTSVLTDVDAYWTRVLEANGYSEPTVRYAWIPEGQSVIDGCTNQPTDETAAFYCPTDDTIYLSEPFVEAVRDNRMSQWPSGDQADGALGDMAVAYVIAHEEGHNIQNELGWDRGQTSTEGMELDADCLAGAWAADAASRGLVDKTDLEEAQVTAWLVGDYAFDNPEHHGTPRQRQTAFTDGYDSLSSCRQYLSG